MSGYTVAALSQYLNQLRQAPGHTPKSLSTIRSGARMVLRHRYLPADLAWDLDTVEDWCDAYASTDHAAALPASTIAAYQHRLRRAARLFDTAQQPPDPQEADRPVWLDDLEPAPRTMHDLRLLAADWRTSPADALARLISFYLTYNPDQTPPNLPNDIDVIASYKGTLVTGVYHRHSKHLTVTSPPLSASDSRRPAPPPPRSSLPSTRVSAQRTAPATTSGSSPRPARNCEPSAAGNPPRLDNHPQGLRPDFAARHRPLTRPHRTERM